MYEQKNVKFGILYISILNTISMPFNVRALSLSGAIIWAAAAFLLALTAQWWGWGDSWVTTLADLYIGYAPGVVGGITGAVWAFTDALIGFALFGSLYNWLLTRVKK